MMMPGYPSPPLIVPQAGLPFGSLETLFDAMCRLGHPGEFLQRRVGVRIVCGRSPPHSDNISNAS